MEKDQVTFAQMSDPARLTIPARTPSTVRAPPLSPWEICWNLLKCWLIPLLDSLLPNLIESFEILSFLSQFEVSPYLAAAFLIAACTKHSLAEGESIFLHICLALNWTRDRNLDSKYCTTYSQCLAYCHNCLWVDTKIQVHIQFALDLLFHWNQIARERKKTNLNLFEIIRGKICFCQAPTCARSK